MVADLQTSGVKDMGMFAESRTPRYIYDFWLNTEGYSELEREAVDPQNEKVYAQIYDALIKLLRDHQIGFEGRGIGVEMMLYESSDLSDILRESKGVVSWILPGDSRVNEELAGYRMCCRNNLMFFERYAE